jgi:hypothetical protein
MGPVDIFMVVLLLAGVAYVAYYMYATVSGILKIAKESKVLAPSPLSDCPDGKEKSGLLCYNKCREGYNRIGATCWLKEVGVGIGRIPPG